jgi:glycine dehydrogenase subunit 2
VKTGGGYRLDYDRPQVDRPRAQLLRQHGVLVRMYCYIRTHGPEGLRASRRERRAQCQLSAGRLKHMLAVPHGDRCMHEFVATAARLKAERGVTAMDIAKRLLDYGFHAPTVYFPLIVPEAMMIEPTETESKATLDAFAEHAVPHYR